MADNKDKPFFVGYLTAPDGLRSFLIGIGIGLVLLMAGVGLGIGATQDDPGNGAFRGDYGRQTVTGVMELTPYPVVRVTQGSEHVPEGHTLMLSAGGKQSLMNRVRDLDGQLVTVSGTILDRGELDMMQVRGGQNGISRAEGDAPEMDSEDLGRWRIAGEICDGKCLAGAMRPGIGIAHKACANLCLIGDIPPVFVSTQPVEGSEFLLVVGPDGTIFPKSAYDLVAAYISVEGKVMRHGDLLVFHLEPDTAELVQ